MFVQDVPYETAIDWIRYLGIRPIKNWGPDHWAAWEHVAPRGKRRSKRNTPPPGVDVYGLNYEDMAELLLVSEAPYYVLFVFVDRRQAVIVGDKPFWQLTISPDIWASGDRT